MEGHLLVPRRRRPTVQHGGASSPSGIHDLLLAHVALLLGDLTETFGSGNTALFVNVFGFMVLIPREIVHNLMIPKVPYFFGLRLVKLSETDLYHYEGISDQAEFSLVRFLDGASVLMILI